ncbi:MAG: FtsH protease activity modulator HflK [Alphaproteobacteria bacterium]|nr:FtsH protease activity modulator HflK [Alphaproteobacteria bacterium]MDY4690002.1 FtsH protease activity modulator HflK [Alphaproteobacteria bacterium]
MVKKINPWDNGGDEDGWSLGGEMFKKNKIVDFSKIAKMQGSKDNFGGWLKYALLLIALLWLASGFYQVQPSEQGVVLRFGRYADTTDAGLHYHLPYPIEDVIKVNVTQERSINLGSAENRDYRNNAFTESHMLTGDENIVDINLTIVWKIKDAKDYLFSMRSPDATVSVAAQSVLREIVGQSEMQPIITGDRGKVEDDTKDELQRVLDEFGAGIQIVRVKLQKADPPREVVDAFNEVQRAKADMERFKNEAEAYRNEVLPKAHGKAAQILQDAEAYKATMINKAQGEADRFASVYAAYKSGKEVTVKKMYLEAMEDVLQKSGKVIVDPSQKGNLLPILQLNNPQPQTKD